MFLIYATDDDKGFIEGTRRALQDPACPYNTGAGKHPLKAVIRNPRFHRSRADVEKCNAVMVRPEYPQVAKDYEAARIPVHLGPSFAELPLGAKVPETRVEHEALVTSKRQDPIRPDETRRETPEQKAETKAPEAETAEAKEATKSVEIETPGGTLRAPLPPNTVPFKRQENRQRRARPVEVMPPEEQP